MKYDFTSLIDRHGMDAIAVDSWGEIPDMAPNAPDEGFDRIPMWVADMNFATVPTVQEHIIQRAQHPMFGYFNPRDEYFDRIIEWQSRRNGVEAWRRSISATKTACWAVSCRRCAHMSSRAMRYWSTVPPTSALPSLSKPRAIALSTARLSSTIGACGAWTLRTWSESSPKTTSMPRCSARRTIPAAAYGGATRSSAPWTSIVSTIAW